MKFKIAVLNKLVLLFIVTMGSFFILLYLCNDRFLHKSNLDIEMEDYREVLEMNLYKERHQADLLDLEVRKNNLERLLHKVKFKRNKVQKIHMRGTEYDMLIQDIIREIQVMRTILKKDSE